MHRTQRGTERSRLTWATTGRRFAVASEFAQPGAFRPPAGHLAEVQQRRLLIPPFATIS